MSNDTHEDSQVTAEDVEEAMKYSKRLIENELIPFWKIYHGMWTTEVMSFEQEEVLREVLNVDAVRDQMQKGQREIEQYLATEYKEAVRETIERIENR